MRGLNTPEKRSRILLSMPKIKADIAFLQETHFKEDCVPKLLNLHFPTAIHTTNRVAKAKADSVLFVKHSPFRIVDSLLDKEGQFLFIKGSLLVKRLTLVNIYASNVKQVPFFRRTLQILASFQEGTLIVGGDFNVPLNSLLDTSSSTSKLPFIALRAIKKHLQE